MVFSVLAVLALAVVLIQLSPVQNFLARKAVHMLAKKLQTEVAVRNVRIDFFNHLLLQGLLMKDRQGDTLLYAGEARLRITDWFFFKEEVPVIRYLGLHDADVHLYRTSKSPQWNYQFVADAFNTGPKDTTKADNEFELDLEALDLKNIRFRMNDAWVGNDQWLRIGSLKLLADEVNLTKKTARIQRLKIRNGSYGIHDYTGGKPADTTPPGPSYVIDTTAFNPAGWKLYAQTLDLKDCGFSLKMSPDPAPEGEFDADHLDITGVDIQAKEVRILNDTITGRIDHLQATERSGILIRHMEADVTVSPILSECKNLLLQTNNSTIGDYYAMHYKRFPDFTEYIDSVRMVAHLKDAQVDMQDIAYFAPPMKWMTQIARASGNFDGTVADFRTENLNVTDGDSRLVGNLAMRGLPEIEETFFSFEKGGIFTTGPAILKWAPQLRNHPAVALEILHYAHFQGAFHGLYDAFLTSGTLVTNLGTITSNVKLSMPPLSGRNATYKGVIRTQAFQIGPFLRIPNVGSISAVAEIEGKGFDPLLAALHMDGNISRFEVGGYPYSNILVNGTLARKKFSGTGQVTDPNVAMSFDGTVDFSGNKPVLEADAHLLQSNWKALGFVDDSTLASADLRIATTGLDLDDFTGTATLYNIDLRRNGARLDLDSIELTSAIDTSKIRKLLITSNALSAELTGRFQLTQVPATTQLFLAGYLPNYIDPPKKVPELQDFTYSIFTHEIDPLFAVLAPQIRGFDSGTLYGYMKTAERRLVAEANFPYGSIGPLHLQKTTVLANGDYERILLTGSSKRFYTSNDLLNATLDMYLLVGNDSLDFSITTQSPNALGTARIGGFAHAHGDTLSGFLRPSEFLLNADRWEISGNNVFAFADGYLHIQNLDIHSGEQRVILNSNFENGKPLLTANISRYDLSNLREIESLREYQTAGRVNGTVQLYEPMRDSRRLKASIQGIDVALGTDTIGNVSVLGTYDFPEGKLVLEPETGIYRAGASLRASGVFDTDSSNAVLNGQIVFDNTPLNWIQPFTIGSVSQLKGNIDGQVNIGGTTANPATNGALVLRNAALRLDYTGVQYTIPTATISVTNRAINLGTIGLYDRAGNRADVSGNITHRNFGDMRFSVDVKTSGMEVLNLRSHENDLYYGNLTAAAEVTLRGTTDNLQLNVMRGVPTRPGHLYLPVTSSNGTGSYSFVTFKDYKESQKKSSTSTPLRFSMNLDAVANPLVEVSMILDPATGDAINGRGNGSIRLELPSGAAARMYGNLTLESGDYTLTLRQVAFQRRFNINSGSTISFSGPIAQTQLNVEAIYPTYARLYDLLDPRQVEGLPQAERTDAQTRQKVDLLLRMKGSLTEPVFTFDINLPDGRSTGTVAETELRRIRQNERELFDQVASLLLIGSFVPSQGIATGTASRSVINNVSDMLSSNVSGQLTNIISKLTGDNQIALDLRYKSYDLAGGTGDGTTTERNEVKLGVRRNFFNDRLIAEVGSAYDWGRPVGNNNRNNFNPVGDFRLQYLLQEDGRLRLNVFHTANYDVLINDNVSRSGAGISYRRSFDRLSQFLMPWRKPEMPVPVKDTSVSNSSRPADSLKQEVVGVRFSGK